MISRSKEPVFDDATRRKVLAEIRMLKPGKTPAKSENDIRRAVARAGVPSNVFEDWGSRGLQAIQRGDSKDEYAQFYLQLRLATLQAALRPFEAHIKTLVAGLAAPRRTSSVTIEHIESELPRLSMLDPCPELDAVREDLRVLKLLTKLYDDLRVI